MKPPLHRFVENFYGSLTRVAAYFALVGAILYGGTVLIGGGLGAWLADGDNTAWLTPKASFASAQPHQSLRPKLRGAAE